MTDTFRCPLVAAALLWLGALPLIQAAEEVTVVLLLKPTSQVSDKLQCQGGADPKIMVLRNVKIAGKSELKLAEGHTGDQVSHAAYGKMRTIKLRDISKLSWQNGMLYASSEGGQPMLVLPDIKTERRASTSLPVFYSTSQLEGEVREGKSKQKPSVPLTSIWKAYLYSGPANQDEALFRHSQEEHNFGQWNFYLKTVSGYKIDEAQKALVQASGACVDQALQEFRAGRFGAIDMATKLAKSMVEMSGGSADAADRLAGVQKEEKDVRDKIQRGVQLSKSDKYDEALDLWKPVEKYLRDPALRDFAAARTETLTKSHNEHVARGDKFVAERALGGANLPQALAEYKIALLRMPDSAQALKGKREMEIQIALAQSKQFREQRNPAKARDALLQPYADYKDDPRLAEELKGASCDLGTQLYERSKPMVIAMGAATRARAVPAQRAGAGARSKPTANTTPAAEAQVRVIASAGDKKPFREARENLKQAVDLCPTPEVQSLLTKVDDALATYHVGLAKKALAKKAPGVALINLAAAQSFAPERSDLQSMLEDARQQAQQKNHIQVGVVFQSAQPQCRDIAQELALEAEGALTGAGGANVQLMSQDQARQMVGSLRTGGGSGSGNFAIISGNIKTCAARPTSQPRNVQSKYAVPNPNYQSLDEQLKNAETNLESCKAANRETEKVACAEPRNRRNAVQDRRNREPQTNWQPYTYIETTVSATGQLSLSMQIDDTIARKTRQAGEASGAINESCVDRKGVNPDDQSAGSNLGASLIGLFRKNAAPAVGTGALHDQDCVPLDAREIMSRMAQQATPQVQAGAAAALRDVWKGFFDSARLQTDNDKKLESYISFVVLSSDKTNPDYKQAIAAIKAVDPDLNPEGAFH